MNALSMMNGFDLVIIAVIFALGLFMPWLARKEIVFGIRFPEEYSARDEIRRLKAGYFKAYMLLGGAYTAALIAVDVRLQDPDIFNYGVIGEVAVMFVLYMIYRTKAFRLKQELRPMEGHRQVTVADTGAGGTVPPVPWAWFLLPAGVTIGNMVLGLSKYDSLPARMPIHFNASGHADSWGPKSLLLVMFIPLVQLFITAMMAFAFSAFRAGKRQLSPQNPVESAVQTTVFNRRWSEWMVVTMLALVSATSLVYWQMLGVMKLAPAELIVGLLAPVAGIIIYAIFLTIKYGQGGTRFKSEGGGAGADPSVVRKDDDRFWKAGLIYYNPEDPSLWVEKRFGVGYTLNFGNRRSWLMMALPLIGVAGILGLSLALVSSVNVKVNEPEFQKQIDPVVQNLFTALKNRQYDVMERDFSDEMKSALTEPKFKKFNEGQLLPRVGEYQSSKFDRFEYKGGLIAAVYKAKFEKDDSVLVRFIFAPGDPETKIMGLWFDSPKMRK
jgi:uncharacterized membrane protein